MAIFENETRSATVRAVGDARVLEVDKKTVERRLQDNPHLAVNMLKTMSSRLREANAERVPAPPRRSTAVSGRRIVAPSAAPAPSPG